MGVDMSGTKLSRLIAPVVLSLAAAGPALSQDADIRVPTNLPPTGGNVILSPLPTSTFSLALLIVAFGVLLIVAQLFALTRVKSLSGNDVARSSILTIVVIATVLILITSLNNTQIAPAFGLFGTIVGYLLGSSRRPDEEAGEKK